AVPVLAWMSATISSRRKRAGRSKNKTSALSKLRLSAAFGSRRRAVTIATVGAADSLALSLPWNEPDRGRLCVIMLQRHPARVYRITPREEAPMPAPYEKHRAQLKAILLAWGMPEDNAEATADILGWADLHGVDSHGISMLPGYDRLR